MTLPALQSKRVFLCFDLVWACTYFNSTRHMWFLHVWHSFGQRCTCSCVCFWFPASHATFISLTLKQIFGICRWRRGSFIQQVECRRACEGQVASPCHRSSRSVPFSIKQRRSNGLWRNNETVQLQLGHRVRPSAFHCTRKQQSAGNYCTSAVGSIALEIRGAGLLWKFYTCARLQSLIDLHIFMTNKADAQEWSRLMLFYMMHTCSYDLVDVSR